MNILFVGMTGVYHPFVAAKLFTGEIKKTDYRIAISGLYELEICGRPIFVGTDDMNNRVYVLGGGPDPAMAKTSIDQLVDILGFSSADFIVKVVKIKHDLFLMRLFRLTHLLFFRRTIHSIALWIVKKELQTLEKQVLAFKSQLVCTASEQ
ncbi:MAG: DUF3189 family protein [Bacillota bacterium]|nr:DUF3189 family protein [Bacillota bacterium]